MSRLTELTKKMLSKKSIFLITLFASVCVGQDYIIEIDQGRLNGSLHYDRKGGIFYSFKRIPYARPPTGNLRFKAPLQAGGWDGILDATVEPPLCMQENFIPNLITSEDCLYINVYTPQFPAQNYDTLLNVMVYIHGGSFQNGDSRQELYGPEYLIPANIILVTFNYRLGIFGSFNLEDTRLGYPGNLNMKDQVLALQWVQSNIARFGGDPNSVTIFGQSAGSASVHYLLLSPMSSGLFHKAIMQSGTALSSWAVGPSNNGIQLAEMLGIPNNNIEMMLEELYRLSASQINSVQQLLYYQRLVTEWGLLGSPIVEQEVEGQTAFLTEKPIDIIQQGNYNQVPILIGYNDADGINFHLSYTQTVDLIPADLDIEIGSSEARDLARRMDNFYFGSQTFDEPLVQMFTDVCFGHPAYRAANEHQKTTNSSIYFYRFSADTRLNMKLNDPLSADYKGAIHSDEICYMFKSINQPIEIVDPGSVEDLAIDRIVSLWTNFAKYGDPAPSNLPDLEWIPLAGNVFNYVDIGSTETVSGLDPDSENMNFWNEIYNEYGTNQ